MSQNNGHAKRSEKGLLTPDTCEVDFIDHQPQMLFGVSNFDRQSIVNNVVALAKATRIFDVPTILSTVETKAFSGLMWPQLRAVFPGWSQSSARPWTPGMTATFWPQSRKSAERSLCCAGCGRKRYRASHDSGNP